MPCTDTFLLFLPSLQYISIDTACKGSLFNFTNNFFTSHRAFDFPAGHGNTSADKAADNDLCEIDRNFEIAIKNSALPGEWKRAIVVPIYKGNDRSEFTKYRPIRLTTVVSMQVEHATAEYLRQVWDKNDWLCEGQHGFRLGYSCESQVITVCQDTADSLYKWVGIDAIIIDFPGFCI